MGHLLLRWVLNALALLIVDRLVVGFSIDSFYIALIAALVLGFVNAVIRPVLLILTLPITFLTLGLFTFVINALMIIFVASFVDGFVVDGFSVALQAALLLWLMSIFTNLILHSRDKE